MGRRDGFWSGTGGGIAPLVALSLTGFAGAAGVALDYARSLHQHTSLQKTADLAALATANELRIGTPDERRLQSIAQAVVDAHVKGEAPVAVTAEALRAPSDAASANAPVNGSVTGVKVTLSQANTPLMSRILGAVPATMRVSAAAILFGGVKVCVIGLDEHAADAVRLEDDAELAAAGCSLYVNSASPKALHARANARATSLLACSAGGYKGESRHFAPQLPRTDCPRTPDPLADRPPPPVGPCSHNNLELGVGLHFLSPGTYCGGLRLLPGAIATLGPGVYVIKDGPLTVGPPVLSVNLGIVAAGVLPATLRGSHVGFYFTGEVKPDAVGATTVMRFMKDSVVEMTAPKTGPMAGLLFHEDRGSAPDRRYDIISDGARRLVGTIYIPRGVLAVHANQRVADQSEYTAVIVRRLHLSQAPRLVLNTRYADTDVPVPNGIGPHSGGSRLIE